MENVESIDLVVHIPGTNRTAFVMVDSDDHIDDIERSDLIKRRARLYSDFIASGAYLNRYPEISDRELEIVIVFARQPTGLLTESIQSIVSQNASSIAPISMLSMVDFRALFGLR